MPRPTITEKTTLHEACEIVAEHIPEDWEIEISLSEGSGDVTLFDHHGHMVNYPGDPSDDRMHDQLESALAYAEEQHGQTQAQS